MTRIFFKFNIYAFCERVLKNRQVKAKIVRKLSLNFTFGQSSCLISDFARANSSKDVLVQIFLRLDTVIFNNNFVFCMMSSFCSMAQIAGWILVREIIKRTNVRLKKLDKHLWRGLFVKVVRLHTTTNESGSFLELWGRCWLKYEKIKKLRKIWRNS